MQEGNIHEATAEPKSKTADVKDTLGDLASHASDYASTFYRLQILNLTKKATDVTANLAGGLVSAVLGIFFLFFGGMALGFWLGAVLDSNALGFLIVAGFFVLVAVIFMSIRKKIVFPMWRNKIIRKLYE
jgi:hypothetical protein